MDRAYGKKSAFTRRALVTLWLAASVCGASAAHEAETGEAEQREGGGLGHLGLVSGPPPVLVASRKPICRARRTW